MKRPYLVTPIVPINGEQKSRLINAGTPAAARLHVTKSLFKINPASAADVAAFYDKGGKIEEAGDAHSGSLPGTETQ